MSNIDILKLAIEYVINNQQVFNFKYNGYNYEMRIFNSYYHEGRKVVNLYSENKIICVGYIKEDKSIYWETLILGKLEEELIDGLMPDNELNEYCVKHIKLSAFI